MARRSKSDVRNDSRKAVEKAGTRERNAPSGSAGAWTDRRGLLKEGPFRPGKTAKKRGR